MPRRRGSFGGIVRGRAPRRQTAWIGGVDNDTFLAGAAGNAVFVGSLNAAALALRPFTVVRVRGLFSLQSDQTGGLEEGKAAFGMAVVSDDAVAIGITALPSPITDQGSDLWFTFTEGNFGWKLVTTGAGVGLTHFEIESRAMRKVGIGEDLILMFENGSASFGCEFDVSLRLLVKLH